MEAKDTVLSDRELGIKAVGFPIAKCLSEWRWIAEAQAEISFKAGIKEVAGWIRGVCGYDHFRDGNGKEYQYLTIITETMQAKIKEWGLEEK